MGLVALVIAIAYIISLPQLPVLNSISFSAIFQQPIVEQYRAALHWLFTRIIRGVVSRGNPILLAKDPETNRILSSAVLVYPESRLNTWDMIKGGIAAFPFVWGFRPLMRLLEADRKCSRDVVDVKVCACL